MRGGERIEETQKANVAGKQPDRTGRYGGFKKDETPGVATPEASGQ